jgi:hypothetical protein
MRAQLPEPVAAGRSRPVLPQVVAFVLGVAFVINGVVGFAITGLAGFTEHTGHDMFGLNVNPLHNLIHLAIGLLGAIMCWRLDLARAFGWLMVVGYGSVMAYGIFAVGQPGINFLALNAADNVVHGLAALAGLVVAMSPSAEDDHSSRGRRAPAPRHAAR